MKEPFIHRILEIKAKRIVQITGIYCFDGQWMEIIDNFPDWASGIRTFPFTAFLTSPTEDGPFTDCRFADAFQGSEVVLHEFSKERLDFTRKCIHGGEIYFPEDERFDLRFIGNNFYSGYFYRGNKPNGVAQCTVTDVPFSTFTLSEESVLNLELIYPKP